MITLKSCKRDGQRLAITLADGDREESVYLGPQSVGSAFIQQESNAQELAKVIVEAVNALQQCAPTQPSVEDIVPVQVTPALSAGLHGIVQADRAEMQKIYSRKGSKS